MKKLTVASLHQVSISKSEARTFLEILITIKRRNPSIRKVLTDNYKDYLNSINFREEIKPGIELAKKIDTINPEKYVDDMINELNTDPSRLHDMYLSSFLGNEKKVTEQVLDTLMQHKMFVYHAPPGSQYITSDNPGFTVVDDIVVNYGGLNEEFRFVFPLTPLCCLLVDGSQIEDPYALDKPLHINHVTSEAVSLTNKATASVAMDKVFSYSKNVLMKFAEGEPHF